MELGMATAKSVLHYFALVDILTYVRQRINIGYLKLALLGAYIVN